MKGSMTAAAMHKQYDEGISAFRQHIANPAMRQKFNQGVDEFMRLCALGVWHADGGNVAPQHVEFYNGIYCKGNLIPSALYWELCTSVDEYGGFQVPDFFQKMREYDRAYGKNTARRFVDTMTLMLLLFAAADGSVSDAEAGFVNRCADTLSALCDQGGLPDDKPKLNAGDFVTRKAGVAPAPAAAAEDVNAEEPPAPGETVDALLAQLDELCGLDKVKKDVKSLINLVKVRKLREAQGLPVPPMSLHLVFMGNPGTGKTTVARLLAKIYHAIGVLSKGQLVEVDRSALVAGFVGQTAIKTGEVIQKALGGVLFIDEAYALANQDNPNDFGKESIEVILKNMEDHRDDLIVIVAGYTALMGKFIDSNPGLQSRFNKYFYFDDYNGVQLMEIFESMCEKNGYTLSEETKKFCVKAFGELYEDRDQNFGNARDVRNIFERGVARQADRVSGLESPTKEQLMELTQADLREEDEAPAEDPEAPPEPDQGPDGTPPETT
ncbi:MAG: AAA family ATPase [Clostridia bacterium]|nr:AAA family ATPase [Clostridia bacterium]